ncbi:MAG: DUF4838 domain-containing protein [Armatimonadetes bacterium]|nr:DUF4838 domain-containing protein [Armatimonadota bacterium]
MPARERRRAYRFGSREHARFREDVRAWDKICDKLILWDYVMQFENLISPYPNFRMLQPNMRFFRDNRSQGVFSQENREWGGEFAEMRRYLLAKLMWSPDCDLDALMNDFLRGYYSPAARPIRRYIDLLRDSLEASGLPLSIDARPNSYRDGYLSEAMMGRYNALPMRPSGWLQAIPKYSCVPAQPGCR